MFQVKPGLQAISFNVNLWLLVENKWYFICWAAFMNIIHRCPNSTFCFIHVIAVIFKYLLQSHINPSLHPKVKKMGSSALLFLLQSFFSCVLHFPPHQSLPFSVLAVAVRHQEYHGFLFADVGHYCGQLVDVAAVEMLRLPQVQDYRGWARFGCKETHVPAQTRGGGEQKRREQWNSFNKSSNVRISRWTVSFPLLQMYLRKTIPAGILSCYCFLYLYQCQVL